MLVHVMNIPIAPALSFALASFFASAFVLLKIVIPVLPPHPLSSRLAWTAFDLPKRPRSLSPADRSLLWITSFDLVALLCFIWQVVEEWQAPVNAPILLTNRTAAARLWISITARQCCLVAVMLYTVFQARLGKAISFGKHDLFLWTSTLLLVLAPLVISTTLFHAADATFFVYLIAVSSGIVVTASAALSYLLAPLLFGKGNSAANTTTWPLEKAGANRERPCSIATLDIRRDTSWVTSYRDPGCRHSSLTSGWSFTGSTQYSSGTCPSSDCLSKSDLATKHNYRFGTISPSITPQTQTPLCRSTNTSLPDLTTRPTISSDLTPGVSPSPIASPTATLDAKSKFLMQHNHDSWLTSPAASATTLSAFSFPSWGDRHSRPFTPLPAMTRSSFTKSLPGRGRSPLSMLSVAGTTTQSSTPNMFAPSFGTGPCFTPSTEPTFLGGVNTPDVEERAGGNSPNTTAVTTRGFCGSRAAIRVVVLIMAIWAPFCMSLPYLVFHAIPSAGTKSPVPAILFILAITTFSPMLAIYMLFTSHSPLIPADILKCLAPESSPHPDNSLTNHPYRAPSPGSSASTVFDICHRLPQSSFANLVEGRRSGDIWIANGDAVDGQSKLERVLSLAKPTPKLSAFSMDYLPQVDSGPDLPGSESFSAYVNIEPDQSAESPSVLIHGNSPGHDDNELQLKHVHPTTTP